MSTGVVFLLDVDNTLLDGDRFLSDLRHHLLCELGSVQADCYWQCLDALHRDTGCVDYLGALQCLRRESGRALVTEVQLLSISTFLIDYPFAQRLYPRALDVIRHLDRFGLAVILTHGDAVLQPRKVQHSGLWDAVGGRVHVCLHKDRMLAEIERSHPARHYVMVDDKLMILAAMKAAWRDRLTTILIGRGHAPLEAAHPENCPSADFKIESIGELADVDLSALAVERAAPLCA